MGMYDELLCEYPLPDNPPAWVQQARLQTQSFEQVLDLYTLTADGELIHHCVEYEWEADEKAFFGGYLKPVREWDVKVPYHGDIVFYTSNITGSHPDQGYTLKSDTGDQPEFYEYRARFTEGRLQWIERIHEWQNWRG